MMGRCREDSSLARSPTQTSSNRGSSLPLTTYLPLSYLLFTNDYRPLPAAAKASERGRRTSQRRGGRAALRQRRAARAAHLQVRERRAGRLRPGVREGDHALSGRAGRATWRVSGEGVSPATRRVIGSCHHHLRIRRRRVSPLVNRCIVSLDASERIACRVDFGKGRHFQRTRRRRGGRRRQLLLATDLRGRWFIYPKQCGPTLHEMSRVS